MGETLKDLMEKEYEKLADIFDKHGYDLIPKAQGFNLKWKKKNEEFVFEIEIRLTLTSFYIEDSKINLLPKKLILSIIDYLKDLSVITSSYLVIVRIGEKEKADENWTKLEKLKNKEEIKKAYSLKDENWYVAYQKEELISETMKWSEQIEKILFLLEDKYSTSEVIRKIYDLNGWEMYFEGKVYRFFFAVEKEKVKIFVKEKNKTILKHNFSKKEVEDEVEREINSIFDKLAKQNRMDQLFHETIYHFEKYLQETNGRFTNSWILKELKKHYSLLEIEKNCKEKRKQNEPIIHTRIGDYDVIKMLNVYLAKNIQTNEIFSDKQNNKIKEKIKKEILKRKEKEIDLVFLNF